MVFNKGQEGIEDYVKPYDIDLVVMGSHGVSGVKETLLGSNTQRFIRHSSVPVLVIKHVPKDYSIHTIAFVSSFEEDDISSFEAIYALANVWKTDIHLLNVNTPYHFKETHESIADMRRFMHQFPGVSYTPAIYNALNEERGIHFYVKENQIDLVDRRSKGVP